MTQKNSWLTLRSTSWIVVALLLTTAAPLAGQDEEDDRPVPIDFGDDPDAPIDSRFEKAQQLHLEGEYAKAYLIYDAILAERDRDVPTLVTYGNMKWKEGDFEGAEAKLLRALEIMPEHIKARQFLGQMYAYQGRRKAAREHFDAMHTLKFMRNDVLNSAKLNLGKMAMIESEFRQAREHFIVIRADGHKADRNSGERGLTKLKWIMRLDDWPRVDSKHLFIHFSPTIEVFRDRATREKWAKELDEWIGATIARLGIQTPDPWPLYVFEDDGECSGYTGRQQAHGWDYSWWLSFWSYRSKIPVRHTLAVQLVARAAGSRPISRCTVEGFCAYLAGEPADAHAAARAIHAAGALPSLLDLHGYQKRPYQLEAGTSFVRYLLDQHGFDAFMVLWKRINIITNAPRFRIGRSTETDWQKAYDTLFTEAFGKSFAQVEAGWRAVLLGGG